MSEEEQAKNGEAVAGGAAKKEKATADAEATAKILDLRKSISLGKSKLEELAGIRARGKSPALRDQFTQVVGEVRTIIRVASGQLAEMTNGEGERFKLEVEKLQEEFVGMLAGGKVHGREAPAESEESSEIQKVDAAVWEFLKSGKPVQVKGLLDELAPLSPNQIFEHLGRLVEVGVLEPGTGSNSPNLKKFFPTEAARSEKNLPEFKASPRPREEEVSAPVEPLESIGSTEPETDQGEVNVFSEILDDVGETGMEEKVAKQFLKRRGFSNRTARDQLATWVRDEKLLFTGGVYKKYDEAEAKKLEERGVQGNFNEDRTDIKSPEPIKPMAPLVDIEAHPPVITPDSKEPGRDDELVKKKMTDALEKKLQKLDETKGAETKVEKPIDVEAIRQEGKKLRAISEDIGDLLGKVASGRELGSRLWGKIGQGLNDFLEQVDELGKLGLPLPERAGKAKEYLETAVKERNIDDAESTRSAMAHIEELLFSAFSEGEDKEKDGAVDAGALKDDIDSTPPDVLSTPDRFKWPENKLEVTSRMRARAIMVKDILDSYASVNEAEASPTAQLLITRLVDEVLACSDNGSLTLNDDLRVLLPQLKHAIEVGDDLRVLFSSDDDGEPREASWRQLIDRLSAGLTNISRQAYKSWAKENPESSKDDFFNREGNEIYDLAIVGKEWIDRLKENDSLDPKLRKLAIKQLEQYDRDAKQKLEIWSEVRVGADGGGHEKVTEDSKYSAGGPSDTAVPSGVRGPDASVVTTESTTPPSPETALPVEDSTARVGSGADPSSFPPLKIKFENGEFKNSMSEAFENEDFYSFFQEFDGVKERPWLKNKLLTPFDPATPFGAERFERSMEAYALWRQATEIFGKDAQDKLQEQFGFRPLVEDTTEGFEQELRRLVIENPAQVSRVLESRSKYLETEKAIEQKEQEIGGLTPFSLEKTGEILAEARDKVEMLSAMHGAVAHERNILREAIDRGQRGFFGRLRDVFRKPSKKNRREPIKVDQSRFPKLGVVLGRIRDGVMAKDQKAISAEVQNQFGELDKKGLEVGLEETHLQYKRLEKMLAEALGDYERIEKHYQLVKVKIDSRERAEQEKEQLKQQFTGMTFSVFTMVDAFKQASDLTAERIREGIRGIIADDPRPGGINKADEKLDQLRVASQSPGAPPEAKELVAQLSSEIELAVTKNLAASASKFKVGSGKGEQLLKLFRGYGERGSQVGVEVLNKAISEAEGKKDLRRQHVLKALLLEFRASSSESSA